MKRKMLIKQCSYYWYMYLSNFEPITFLAESLLAHAPRGCPLQYMSYMGMCGPKGYGFPAVLVINVVLILAEFSQIWS